MAEPIAVSPADVGVIPPAVDDFLGRTYEFDGDTLQVIAHDPDLGWRLWSPTFKATWVSHDALDLALELGVFE